MVCEMGEPTVTRAILTLDGVPVRAAWTPLPLTGTSAVAPCELATVMLPEICSEAVGVKDIFIVAF